MVLEEEEAMPGRGDLWKKRCHGDESLGRDDTMERRALEEVMQWRGEPWKKARPWKTSLGKGNAMEMRALEDTIP
ncbi:Hypothetical predicted protein [Olea europaea subsp. europaea]|uniref:Uncharacterized protein n=1 Tax=Olea europaea subsp. europaea TaxID=158383 RepID=A0A8S0RXU2_OLEEU|nr:Hypothetical predicted protein [Olea europaea subsp. europaea]